MIANPKVDDRSNQPKLNAAGQQQMETFVAIAIPKTPGHTSWQQTDWGAQMVRLATADWPRGESRSPTFAWKVEDGDSTVPNKRGVANNTREGFPGHWIVKASTLFEVQCYHPGRYDPMADRIRDQNEIKCGDYCRLLVQVKGNGSKDSPGMYVNPSLLELSRAGELIVTMSGPSAAGVFGAVAPAPAAPAPAPAAPAPAAPAPAPAAPAPAPDFLTPAAPPPPPPAPVKYLLNGQAYLKEQLLAGGWTEASIDQLPKQ